MKKTNNLFKNAFINLLEADLNIDLAKDIEDNLDGAPMEEDLDDNIEINAMADSLDDDVSPEDYLTDPAADKRLQQQIEQRNKEIASVIEGWANKIDDFVKFLNSADDNSLQTILSKAQPGTLLAKVQSSNSRKIANSAQELASLRESLLSFVGQKAISQS